MPFYEKRNEEWRVESRKADADLFGFVRIQPIALVIFDPCELFGDEEEFDEALALAEEIVAQHNAALKQGRSQ